MTRLLVPKPMGGFLPVMNVQRPHSLGISTACSTAFELFGAQFYKATRGKAFKAVSGLLSGCELFLELPGSVRLAGLPAVVTR
jgi:hypothetical protein